MGNDSVEVLALMHLTLEFGGGLELLFGSVKTHQVEVPVKDGKELKMETLLVWIRDNLLKERPEMFMKDKSMVPTLKLVATCRRPGVLVLINDCDWELCGRLEATLNDKDAVVFISTLHDFAKRQKGEERSRDDDSLHNRE